MRRKATAARLEAAEQGINSRENVMEALAREEMMIIHHNHAIASQLRRDRQAFTRQLTDRPVPTEESNGDEALDHIIDLQEEGGLPLLRDYSA